MTEEVGAERTPITEADLHAYADGQLPVGRRLEVEAYLASRPDDRARVQSWLGDNRALRELLEPVLAEPIPGRIRTVPSVGARPFRQLALAACIAAFGAGVGWVGRGALSPDPGAAYPLTVRDSTPGFARHAAVAHAVYSPEVRRPVEVGIDQESQLVAWLSKRLGAHVDPPRLGRVGYELIGGRLLPGERGAVAQFMYHDRLGRRLTLYMTREAEFAGDHGFRFSQQGPVSVIYWVGGGFGYALSAGVSRDELYEVAEDAYRQLRRG